MRAPRHLTLPGWIRFFAWLYVVSGVISVSFVASAAIYDIDLGRGLSLTAFGFKYAGPFRAWQPLAISVALAVAALIAFLLLWGYKPARRLALAFLYAALAARLAIFWYNLHHGRVTISLSPLLEVLALVSLHGLQEKWDHPSSPTRTDDLSLTGQSSITS